MDSNKHFIQSFKAVDHPMVFYYGMGLLLDLAIVGIFAFCSGNRSCGNDEGCNNIYCYQCYFGDMNCAGCGEAGEGAIVILFIIIVVFALVGIVALVVAGVAFSQRVIQRHAHILQKRQLALDVVVADLADDANDIEAAVIPSQQLFTAHNPIHLGGVDLAKNTGRTESERSVGSLSGRYPQLSREQRRELENLGLL
jgi:hypothetical protein